MIIDANGYWGRWGIRVPGINDPDEFLRTMDNFQIDKAAICSLKSLCHNTIEGNNEILDCLKYAPDRFIGVGVINPHGTVRSVETELQRLLEGGISALRLYPGFYRFKLSDEPLLRPITEWAEKHRMPIYVTAGILPGTLYDPVPIEDDVREFARANLNLHIILSGVQVFPLVGLVRLLRETHNTFIEISTYQGCEGARLLSAVAGPNRVLMGTAYGLWHPSVGIGKVQMANISDEARKLILGANAKRLFRIKE